MNSFGLYITRESSQSGELYIEGHVRVDGSFSGSLHIEGDFHLGPTGLFEGEVHAENAYIDGIFLGLLEATQQTHLKSSAKFQGILDTQKAEIAIGTQVIGEVRICCR